VTNGKTFGNRKFYSTIGYVIIALGLGFSALMVDKVSGSEFIQVVLYTGAVVSAYSGLNVAKEIWRKKDGN